MHSATYKILSVLTLLLAGWGLTAQLSVTVFPDGDVCDGTQNPLVANATGGDGNYTYQWSNGATTQSIGGLTGGYYSVTVTDQSGGFTVGGSLIADPLALTLDVIPGSCFLACDASINSELTGGTAPYSYQWSNGSTGSVLGPLPPGTFTLTVTDANGCTVTQTGVVTEPDDIDRTINVTGNCSPSANIDVVVSGGGTPPYTYQWSTGATTPSLTGVGQGYYYLTITDDNGCQVDETVIISGGATGAIMVTNQTCAGGNLELCVFSGEGPYTYQWSNGATTQTQQNVPAGEYTVTLTDAGGCTLVLTETVGGDADGTGIDIDVTSTSSACSGAPSGSATATPSGGTAPYTYQWSNGGTGPTISNVAPGTYTVTVTDATGCSGTASVTVAGDGGGSLLVATDATNADCLTQNGTTTVTGVTGGTAPYTYQWSNGGTGPTIAGLASGVYTVTVTDASGCFTGVGVANVQQETTSNLSFDVTAGGGGVCGGTGSITLTNINSDAPPVNFTLNGDPLTVTFLDGLAPGVYTVAATDASGCGAVTKTITIFGTPSVSASASATPTNCPEDNSGTITLNITGGTGPFTVGYNGGGTSATLNNQGSTVSVTGLAAGTYTFNVTDANGCTASTTVSVDNPSNLTVATSSTPSACAGPATGTATATPNGGTGPFTYLWSTGDMTATVGSLAPGTYTVTVTDAAGCSGTASVVVDGTGGGTLTVTATATDTDCNQATGTATVTSVDGGTGPYTYVWSNGASGISIGALAGGTYTVTVSDASGCFSGTTSVGVNTPSNLDFDLAVGNGDDCAVPTSLTVTNVTSNNPPVSFTVNGQPLGGTTLDGLSPGTYTVVATDACGSVAQTVTLDDQAVFQAVAGSTPSQCPEDNSGTVTLTLTNGVGPFLINYTTLDGTSVNLTENSTTITLTGLAAGNYPFVITDANGCTATAGTTVGNPSNLSFATAVTPSDCDTSNGSITISGINSTAGTVTFTLDGAPLDGLTATGLAAGTYTIVATDASGCASTAVVTVGQVGDLDFDLQAIDADCEDDNGQLVISNLTSSAGGIVVEVNGVVQTLLGDTLSVPAGDYTVTVTDNADCVVSQTVSVGNESALTGTVSTPEVTTCDEDGATVTLVADFTGADNLTYTWDFGTLGSFTGDTVTLTVPTNTDVTYELLVNSLDADCPTTLQDQLNVPAPTLTLPDELAGCEGSTLTLSSLPDDQEYVFTGDIVLGGANTPNPTLDISTAGTFPVVVTASLPGSICTVTDTLSVVISPDSVMIDPTLITTSQCTDGQVTFTNGSMIGAVTLVFPNGDTLNLVDEATIDLGDAIGTTVDFEILPDLECAQPTTGSVAVNEPPTLGFDVTTDCSDSTTVTLTNLTMSGFDLDSIVYLFSDGSTSTDENPVLIFDENTQLEVTQIVFFDGVCSDTLTDVVDVVVFQPEDPTPADAVCAGGEVQLYPNADPALEYDWSDGLPSVPNPTVTLDASATFSVTITDPATGCESVREVSVTVIEENVSATLDAPQNRCEPGTVTLNVGNLSPAGSTVVWTVDGMQVGTMPTLNFQVDESTEFVATITSPQGCEVLVLETSVNLTPISVDVDQSTFDACRGASVEDLDLNVTSDLPFTTEWSPADPTTTELLESGTYSVTVTNDAGCTAETSFDVNVIDVTSRIAASAQPDTILVGRSTQLDVTRIDGATYTWNNAGTLSDPSVANPVATPTTTTTYTVTVDDRGCTGTASVTAVVLNLRCEETIFVPNAFTPNQDGRNDEFIVQGNFLDRVNVLVFNRWGERVFESDRKDFGWDGTFNGEVQCTDVYGYYIEAQCFDNETIRLQGNVTLLR